MMELWRHSQSKPALLYRADIFLSSKVDGWMDVVVCEAGPPPGVTPVTHGTSLFSIHSHSGAMLLLFVFS